ncbi:hypothetical protein MNB_ARC-1_522 [hydrothermal vent metagenome]|uniref:Lipoprotein n=1 Tax=hydrothermal vent metagenome TaxID=652676 RepID=A0A3B1DS08_9ZZZZ
MFRKLISLLTIIIAILSSGCNSIIFDQNAVDKSEEFNKKLNGFKRDFSMENAKKDYETNRIFNNDFPITYRAKRK